MELPHVSIVIPTYNRAKSLEMTIQSFLKLDYPKDRYELVVVDNNSNDDTGAVIDRIKASSEVPIQHLVERRQGVHYARNTAAKAARFDFLYYTDDDMEADPQLMRRLVRVFELEPRVASVGGRVLPIWEVPPPKWILQLCLNGWLSLNDRPENLIISPEDPGVYSCHQLMRKKTLMDAGGFNPENTAGVWIGDGETGLNIKIKENGGWFAYVGDSIIYHRIPPQRLTMRYLVKRSLNQGFSDGYTVYRREIQQPGQLLRGMLKHFLCAVWEIRYLIPHLIRQRPQWRLSWARLFYYRARIQYDWRLLRSAEWRTLVLRTNWIAE